MITEFLVGISNDIQKFSQGNQLLGGAIGVWMLGVLSIFMKVVPMRIYKFVYKHTTTTMKLTTANTAYFTFVSWLHSKNVSDHVRNIKILSGRWGTEAEITKGIGAGTHLIWYKHRPIFLHMTEKESHTDYDKEEIILEKYGRSHKLFDQLIHEATLEQTNLDKTLVQSYGGGWQEVTRYPKRSFESVILPVQTKQSLIDTFDRFLKNEADYIKKGIPYQLGILLYGPPGTGKSSLIKAIAAHLNYSVSVLSSSKMGQLTEALSTLSLKTICVIEDVDSNVVTHVRKSKKSKKFNNLPRKTRSSEYSEPLSSDDNDEPLSETDGLMEALASTGLAAVLNSIDGLTSVHGRILLLTTNHPEKLDPALIRPGRIDLKLEIGYVDNEMLETFIKRFYTENVPVIHGNVVEKLTVAILQQAYLSGMDLDSFIEKFTK